MKTAVCCFSWLKSWFYGHCCDFFLFFCEGSESLQVGTDRQINIHALCVTLMHQQNVFCHDTVQERNHNMRNNHSNAHPSHARTRARSQAGTYGRFLVSGDPRVQNLPFLSTNSTPKQKINTPVDSFHFPETQKRTFGLMNWLSCDLMKRCTVHFISSRLVVQHKQ